MLLADKWHDLGDQIEASLQAQFKQIDRIKRANTQRVLEAFWQSGIAECNLAGSTGYGYDDIGREKLEQIYAQVMGAEAALVRHQFCSGTHVLSVMLNSLLAPNDELIIATGTPYDTLSATIGLGTARAGSLISQNVKVTVVDLIEDKFDLSTIGTILKRRPKVLYVQKSCGYAKRKSLSNEHELQEFFAFVKQVSPTTIIAVDNCYGEFVETIEPCMVGADIVGGSLIKNPGGGIAPTGGYIAGRASLVEKAAERLTAVGVGSHVGATLGLTRLLAQGFYLAPLVVSEAIKSAQFVAKLYAKLGYSVRPAANEPRADLVQTVEFNARAKLITFCQAIQSACPIDSTFAPEPAPMPGYDCDIIMASGSFIAGSSIEVSADGPLREPYCAFFQGGLNYENGRLAALRAAAKLEEQAHANA